MTKNLSTIVKTYPKQLLERFFSPPVSTKTFWTVPPYALSDTKQGIHYSALSDGEKCSLLAIVIHITIDKCIWDRQIMPYKAAN